MLMSKYTFEILKAIT